MAIREEKERKGIQIRKEIKLSLFAGDIILYIDNLKDVTRKLLDLKIHLVKSQDKNWYTGIPGICIH